MRGDPIFRFCRATTHVQGEEACKHKWSVRYSALPQCVLIRLTCTAPGTNILPLPPATNAATAAITFARCCLYHSFSSQPPPPPFYEFRVPSISPHPSSYFLPLHSKPSPLSMTTQIPPIPPSSSLSAVCPPGLGRTHDLLILLAGPAHNTQHQYALHSSTQHNSGLLTTHCNPRHTDGGAKPQYGQSAF